MIKLATGIGRYIAGDSVVARPGFSSFFSDHDDADCERGVSIIASPMRR
jgi:hypothetical protein